MSNTIESIPVKIVNKTNQSYDVMKRGEFLRNSFYSIASLSLIGSAVSSKEAQANLVVATFLIELATFGMVLWDKFSEQGEDFEGGPEFHYNQYEIICIGCGDCWPELAIQPMHNERGGEEVYRAMQACPVADMPDIDVPLN